MYKHINQVANWSQEIKKSLISLFECFTVVESTPSPWLPCCLWSICVPQLPFRFGFSTFGFYLAKKLDRLFLIYFIYYILTFLQRVQKPCKIVTWPRSWSICEIRISSIPMYISLHFVKLLNFCAVHSPSMLISFWTSLQSAWTFFKMNEFTKLNHLVSFKSLVLDHLWINTIEWALIQNLGERANLLQCLCSAFGKWPTYYYTLFFNRKHTQSIQWQWVWCILMSLLKEIVKSFLEAQVYNIYWIIFIWMFVDILKQL